MCNDIAPPPLLNSFIKPILSLYDEPLNSKSYGFGVSLAIFFDENNEQVKVSKNLTSMPKTWAIKISFNNPTNLYWVHNIASIRHSYTKFIFVLILNLIFLFQFYFA